MMRLCPDVPRPGSIRRSAPIVFLVATLLALSAQTSRAQQFDYDPDGFWKMPSPPNTRGEFDGEDPIGLASRQHIPTDCAINWKDEAGKTYCFASAMSSQIFQDERTTILPKAVAFWGKEHPRKPPPPATSKSGAPPLTPEAQPQPR